MQTSETSLNRRGFLKKATAISASFPAAGLMTVASFSHPLALEDNPNIIGPKPGFSPLIGSLVSMMDWMRMVVLYSVQNLTTDELDYIHDKNANSIGAMLLHLAATEKYYHLHTFAGKPWGTWDESIKKEWDIPMELGEKGRETIKGHKLEYYLEKLSEVRKTSMDEFKKRDDAWLLAVDKEWGWGPTNNFCKWFHVCEHESNHNGQIKWIRSRIPGAKPARE